MNQDPSKSFVRSLSNVEELVGYTKWLTRRLSLEMAQLDKNDRFLSGSQAEEILKASECIDNQTLLDFQRSINDEAAIRVLIYSLLNKCGIEDQHAFMSTGDRLGFTDEDDAPWLSLVLAAFSWRSEYSLSNLDPSAPPAPHSPAGQVLRQSAQFLRQQVQYSPVDRDLIARQLESSSGTARSLDKLSPSDRTVLPLPPHFRPPIPETYPEIAGETLLIDHDDTASDLNVDSNQSIVIDDEDLASDNTYGTEVRRMPPLTIRQDQIAPESSTPPSPIPDSGVILPTATSQARPNLTLGLRKALGQEKLVTTKLKVYVQVYPDGPGLYGLQVRVSCRGIKSRVAGTTNRQGLFICELPVRVKSGLTYDIEVTWPRDEGGDTERKSITLNADRTHFKLPFYRSLHQPEGDSSTNTE